jgi:hypothetical protein
MRAPIRCLGLLLACALALGASAAEIALRDGRVLKDVKILERGPDSVLVISGGTVARISGAQVTPECAAALGISGQTTNEDSERTAAEEARRKEAEQKEAAARKERERRANREAITSQSAWS